MIETSGPATYRQVTYGPGRISGRRKRRKSVYPNRQPADVDSGVTRSENKRGSEDVLSIYLILYTYKYTFK